MAAPQCTPTWLSSAFQVNQNDFTLTASDCYKRAEKLALTFGNPTLSTLHLLKSMMNRRFTRGCVILRNAGMQWHEAMEQADMDMQSLPKGIGEAENIIPDGSVQNVVSQAKRYKKQFGDLFVSEEHLLLAFAKDPQFGMPFYEKFGVSEDTLREAVLAVRGNKKILTRGQARLPIDPAVMKYGVDLTLWAEQGRLYPLIGRDFEIKSCIRSLMKREKCNAILVGDAGVGKTKIAEGLAQMIVEHNVPEALAHCRLISIDLAALRAGTTYHGQLEERWTRLINAVDRDVILFIDEIHTLVERASHKGSTSTNILKPALARGNFKCIGATTFPEYNEIINDKALERRFDKVEVQPSTVEDTLIIFQGYRSVYENFYGIEFSDEAFRAAASLAKNYITTRALPDTAISLMEETAVVVQLRAEGVRQEIVKLQKQKASLGNLEEDERLRINIDEMLIGLDQQLVVREIDVAEVLSAKTGIPTSRFLGLVDEKLNKLNSVLNDCMVGQESAIAAVIMALSRWMLGLSDPKLPIGRLLFLGPTGVGKTALAKAVALALFDNEQSFIHIDMSQYKSPQDGMKLVGGHPSYINSEIRGQLTEQVIRKPYSVVLLDEIEKANPAVLDLFLPVLSEGYLVDGWGVKVNFRNTVMIMTSNVGSASVNETTEANCDNLRKRVIAEAKSSGMRDEFLARNKIVIFHSLEKHHLLDIAKLKLKALADRKEFQIEASEEALELLVESNFDDKQGARALEEAIEDYVLNSLVRMRRAGLCTLQGGEVYTIGVEDGELLVSLRGQ